MNDNKPSVAGLFPASTSTTCCATDLYDQSFRYQPGSPPASCGRAAKRSVSYCDWNLFAANNEAYNATDESAADVAVRCQLVPGAEVARFSQVTPGGSITNYTLPTPYNMVTSM